MQRLVYLVPIVVLVVLGVYFTLGLGRDPEVIPSALIDKPVPEFSLPPIDGHDKGLSSADLKGQVSLVNVWASWCLPCRVEHATLTRIAEDGVPIFGINYKDKAADANAFLADLGNPFAAIGADTNGRAAIDWGVTGYPESFIVDRNGVIRYKHVGPISQRAWERTLRPIIQNLKGS